MAESSLERLKNIVNRVGAIFDPLKLDTVYAEDINLVGEEIELLKQASGGGEVPLVRAYEDANYGYVSSKEFYIEGDQRDYIDKGDAFTLDIEYLGDTESFYGYIKSDPGFDGTNTILDCIPNYSYAQKGDLYDSPFENLKIMKAPKLLSHEGNVFAEFGYGDSNVEEFENDKSFLSIRHGLVTWQIGDLYVYLDNSVNSFYLELPIQAANYAFTFADVTGTSINFAKVEIPNNNKSRLYFYSHNGINWPASTSIYFNFTLNYSIL